MPYIYFLHLKHRQNIFIPKFSFWKIEINQVNMLAFKCRSCHSYLNIFSYVTIEELSYYLTYISCTMDTAFEKEI